MIESLGEPYLEFARYNTWANRRVVEMLVTLSDVHTGPPARLFSHLLHTSADSQCVSYTNA